MPNLMSWKNKNLKPSNNGILMLKSTKVKISLFKIQDFSLKTPMSMKNKSILTNSKNNSKKLITKIEANFIQNKHS